MISLTIFMLERKGLAILAPEHRLVVLIIRNYLVFFDKVAQMKMIIGSKMVKMHTAERN